MSGDGKRSVGKLRFDFLGYSFGPHCYKGNGQWYLSASPSKKSMQRLKTKVGNLLVPANNDPWSELRDTLNRYLRGWSNYFCHGTRRAAFRAVDRYVYERVRDFLARRHKVAGRGTRSCRAFLSEVFASLSVSPSLVITACVHARASSAHPRLRMTKSSA